MVRAAQKTLRQIKHTRRRTEIDSTIAAFVARGITLPFTADELDATCGPESGIFFEPISPRQEFRLDTQPRTVTEGLLFEQFTWVGITIPKGAKPPPRVIRNCLSNESEFWNARFYLQGPIAAPLFVEFHRCGTLDIVREHARYGNVSAGNVLHSRQEWTSHVGAQVVQTVCRETEGDTLSGAIGEIQVERHYSYDPGWTVALPSNRASFAYSYFQAQTAVPATPYLPAPNKLFQLECVVDKSMQASSTGFLLVQARPLAVIEWQAFIANSTTQPLIKLEDLSGTISGGTAYLDNLYLSCPAGQNKIDVSGFQNVWLGPNIVGDAILRVHGVDKGLASLPANNNRWIVLAGVPQI